MTKAVINLSFEEALQELEGIVQKMESGEVPLDSAIDLYARGNQLKEHCSKKLEEAKLKVSKVLHKDGALVGEEKSELEDIYDDSTE
jgi:exodeoxyribonuclease VII small subunit